MTLSGIVPKPSAMKGHVASSRAVNESVTVRHIVLATGPRRPMREAVIVVMSARIVLSMSAPSATQRPVETGMTPAVTRPEVMITAARLEKQPKPRHRPSSTARIGEWEISRKRGASSVLVRSGIVAATMRLSASMMMPRPIRMRPNWP